MDGRLADRTAIVTGSSNGIGKAIAERFGREGARVVTNSRSLSRAEETATEIEAAGGTALAVEADISVADDRERLLAEAVDAFGSVDVLVNNAGIETVVPVMEMTPAEWNAELDVNLTGTFFCTQTAARHMIDTGGGQIVNISSFLGKTPLQGRAAYCASKAAIDNLTKTFAVELADHDICVNALAPGYIGGTDIVSDDRVRIPDGYEPTDGETWPTYRLSAEGAVPERVPLGRKGRVEEMATCATFLAEGGHYVTGEVLYADGGVGAFGWGSKG